MYNLSNLEDLLLDRYIEIINEFIGGEPAIVRDKEMLPSKDTYEFLQRLSDAIIKTYNKKEICTRSCPFRKGVK